MMRQNGLALGGSLENAIVLGETGILNNALRFEDEFVRHKILDAIGDLALVGYPVIGHLVAHRAGHALHTEFAAKILEETNAWRLVEAPVDTAVGLPVRSQRPQRGWRTSPAASVTISCHNWRRRSLLRCRHEERAIFRSRRGDRPAFHRARPGKPDFTGTWTLDAAKSDAPGRGGRGGAQGPITVTQDANTLTQKRGEQTLVYKLDGSESSNEVQGRGGVQTVKSKAKWEGAKAGHRIDARNPGLRV
jgi:hypothetical protein